MDAYDRLPHQLRLAVRQSLHRPVAAPLLDAWGRLRWGGAGAEVLPLFAAQMMRADRQLLEAFARGFERQYKIPYPHTAARASILYSEPMPAY